MAMVLLGICLLLGGCDLFQTDQIKLRDLEFTVMGEDLIPQELMKMLEERKEEPFRLTFTDQQDLYICIGYGKQETGGYSIAVDEMYLTEDAIMVKTTLLGPDAAQKSRQTPSYPYIVLKTEYLEETVICL